MPTKPPIYAIIGSQIAMMITDTNSVRQLYPTTLSGKSTYIFRKLQECVMQAANTLFQALKWPPRITTERYSQGNSNFGT